MIIWFYYIISISCKEDSSENIIVLGINQFCDYIRYDEGIFPESVRLAYKVITLPKLPARYIISKTHNLLMEHSIIYNTMFNAASEIYYDAVNHAINFLERHNINTECVGNIIDIATIGLGTKSFAKSFKTIKVNSKLLKEANKVKKTAKDNIKILKTDLIKQNKCYKSKCQKAIEKFTKSAEKKVDNKIYFEFQKAKNELEHRFSKEQAKLRNSMRKTEFAKKNIKQTVNTNFFDFKSVLKDIIVEDFSDKLKEKNVLDQLYEESLLDMKKNSEFEFLRTEKDFTNSFLKYIYPKYNEESIYKNFSFKDMCDGSINKEKNGLLTCFLNSFGLPNNIDLINAKDYTISGLSASDICKLYWTLRRIDVNYSYNANGISISRAITAQTHVKPHMRIFTPVDFYTTGFYSGISNLIRLDFHSIYMIGDNNFGLKFLTGECDSIGTVDFSTYHENFNDQLYGRICYIYKFMNTTSRIFLVFEKSVIKSTMIHHFSVNLNFFD